MFLSRLTCHVIKRGLASTTQHLSAPKSNLAKLRKKTGYSLSLCKQALQEANQDFAKAKEWLEQQALEQGWAKAQKLGGRNATQGLIGLLIRDDMAAMVELNCETDFVARNSQFHELLSEVTVAALLNVPQGEVGMSLSIRHSTTEDLANLRNSSGHTVADLVALNIGQIGENIVVRRGVSVRAAPGIKLSGVTHPSGNIHKANNLQYGRFGALLAFAKEDNVGVIPRGETLASVARQISQHVIGMNPTRVGDISTVKAFEVPVEVKTDPTEHREGETADEQSENVNVPTYGDHEDLVHQAFLLDPSMKVGHVMKETGIFVKDFVRFEVGQDLDD